MFRYFFLYIVPYAEVGGKNAEVGGKSNFSLDSLESLKR